MTPPVTPAPPPATATPEVPTVTPPGFPDDPIYHAIVRETQDGVVHIIGVDLGSVAFGHGYTLAENHVCILADQIVKVRSERSRYFGPGDNGRNLDSDFGYLTLNVYPNAVEALPRQSEEVQEMVAGFAAGFNKYLEDTPADQRPPDCANAEWVQLISETDLFAYYLSMSLLASSDALIPAMARAQPPTSGERFSPPPTPSLRAGGPGSNGWGIGGDRTLNGRGMVAANPHFPWEGQFKFFEVQLTVPGLLNVYGAALLGSVVPNIAFNDSIGWTHTFSWAARGVLYRLILSPRNPTLYLYDGEFRPMTSTTYEVEVRQEDGTLATESRTLYRTHYGPIISTEDFGWTGVSALSYRDANEECETMIEQFLQMGMASTLEAFIGVHETVQGIPWAHTMAADREGNAFYVDSSSVPNLAEETITQWQQNLEDDPLTQIAWDLGVPLLDGADPTNEWIDDPRAARPGIVPFADAPQLLRADFVANSNDSHWLGNPAEPLEGYSPLYGPERTPRSPRTRMNLTLLTEVGADGASGEDHRFTLEELQSMMMGNRGLMQELLREALVARCEGVTTIPFEGERVDISGACEAIAGWNGLADLDEPGAVAWREFLGSFDSSELRDAGDLFAAPFDPDDPVATPNTLAPAPESGSDPVLEALAGAVVRLSQAGFDPGVTLREAQFTWKGDERIPLHGGQEVDGAYQVLYYSNSINKTLLPIMDRAEVLNDPTDLTTEGYLVNYGSSFLLALEFTDTGPRAKGLLTYSQSSDPRSDHFADQTHRFAQKQWRDIRFTEEEIAADPELRSYDLFYWGSGVVASRAPSP